MRALIVLVPLMLTACSGGDSSGTSPDAPAGTASPASVACEGLPEFVALAEPKAVTFCSQGEATPGRISGTVMYRTALAPGAVMDFYRARAKQAGIPDSIANPDPTGPMYSAREGEKRSFMAIAVPQKDGSEVTLNWGRPK